MKITGITPGNAFVIWLLMPNNRERLTCKVLYARPGRFALTARINNLLLRTCQVFLILRCTLQVSPHLKILLYDNPFCRDSCSVPYHYKITSPVQVANRNDLYRAVEFHRANQYAIHGK